MAKTIDTEGARELHSQGARFVDVLPRESFLQEHIVGSVNIPLAELTSAPADLGPGGPVVVYCFDFQ